MRSIFSLGLLFCFTFNSTAQIDTASIGYALDEIRILGNRSKVNLREATQHITVLTKEDIKALPARSIQEVLQFAAGVDIRQRGPGGVQADIGVRGGSFEQTLILINGMKLSDPQTGHHAMNIPVPLEAIERIEVIKGPGTRMFGQNALSGAINIVTSLGDKRQVFLTGFGGDFNTFGSSLFATIPVKNYRQNIAASFANSAGHWYNSDYKVVNINYESQLEINPSNSLRGMIGFTSRDFGANGYYTSIFPDQWENTETIFANLQHKLEKKKFSVETRAYYRLNWDEFRLKRMDPEFYTNYHQTDVFGIETNGTISSVLGETGLGVEARNEHIFSTNLGDRTRAFYAASLEQYKRFFKRFDVRAGLHGSFYTTYQWKLFPSVELGLPIGKVLYAHASYSQSYRLPTYTELFYQDPGTSSNQDIIPESAQTYDAGIRYNYKWLKAEVVYFRRYSNNLIDYVRDSSIIVPNPNKWTPQNIGNVVFDGVETSFAIRLKPNKWWVNVSQVSVSYNYTEAKVIQEANVESRYALNTLNHQFIAGLEIDVLGKVQWMNTVRYIKRLSGNEYNVVDSKLSIKIIPHLQLFTEISNVFNTEYIEAGFVQMPGRWAKVGCTLSLR